VAEEREAAAARENKDLESRILKLEDNLARARDTATDRKAALVCLCVCMYVCVYDTHTHTHT